ncbi:MAG: hypothetical protein R2941_08055 [Desulfobacterales bacterium]
MSEFTHIDLEGGVRMVDVSHKEPTTECKGAEGHHFHAGRHAGADCAIPLRKEQ